jgi:5-methylcytosine-specific restriction protein A
VRLNFNHGLKIGETIINDQLSSIFKCSKFGGMRRSHRTNTLVIVSDHTKGVYEDRWINDILHYTGMGLEGNQRIDATQNKTLAESHTNGILVFLFEVFESGNYVFQGQVELIDDPYQELQPDKNGDIRNVWVFKLKPIDPETMIPIPANAFEKKKEKREKEARHLSDEELIKRIKYSKKKAGLRKVTSTEYERNADVSEYAKRRANGICELCEQIAPFKTKKGEHYLESHHIIWLSKDGEDAVENSVALCPNCHRKMHSLNLKTDIKHLKAKAQRSLT